MPDDRRDIISARGVTPELWKTLDEIWGSEITGPLRKLDLVRNHKGPYHPNITRPSDPSDWPGGSHNKNIELLEARFGPIKDISSGKPSVWFLIKHTEEQDKSRVRISNWCHFRIWMQFFRAKEDGSDHRESIIAKDFPVHIIKFTPYGPDLYVLLEMTMEQSDWGKHLPGLKGPPGGRIGPGERMVVHLKDSKQGFGYRCGIWQADVNWT